MNLPKMEQGKMRQKESYVTCARYSKLQDESSFSNMCMGQT
jgi:hypothetical protein